MERRDWVCRTRFRFSFSLYLVISSVVVLSYVIWKSERNEVISLQEESTRNQTTHGVDLQDGLRIVKDLVKNNSTNSPELPRNLQMRPKTSSIPKFVYEMKPMIWDSLPDHFLEGYKSPCWMYGEHGQDPKVLRCLPYFHILGWAKSGSTELWTKLVQHPQIFNKVGKEVRWWNRGGTNFGRYLNDRSEGLVNQFRQNETLKNWLVSGEGTVSEAWDLENWKNSFGNRYDGPEYTFVDLLHAVQPDAKLIFTIRDPVARTFAHYVHFNPKGNPNKFHQLCVAAVDTYRKCLETKSVRACAYPNTFTTRGMELLISLYAVFLRDWLSVFPRDQIYIQRLEDWEQNCTKLLPEVHAFLELEPLPAETIAETCGQPHVNVKKWRYDQVGAMLNETRVMLQQFFEGANQELSQLLNDDRYLWR